METIESISVTTPEKSFSFHFITELEEEFVDLSVFSLKINRLINPAYNLLQLQDELTELNLFFKYFHTLLSPLSSSFLVPKTPFEYLSMAFPHKTEQTGSSSNSRTIEDLFESLERDLIFISDPSDVREYLYKYPDIIGLIKFVGELITDKFDINSQVTLEVFHDPEVDDSYLTFYIRQKDYEDDIMDKIDEISERFEPYLQDVKGWLLVTTDFSPPN